MDEGALTVAGVRWSSLGRDDLSLHLNNTIDAVEEGRRLLEPFCLKHALSAKAVNRIEVVFEEVVSNIVRHGFGPQTDQSIRIHVQAQPDAVELVFEDDGAPFDPLAAIRDVKFESLQTAKLGGLGIPLVVGLCASARYERPAEPDPGGDAQFRPNNRLIVRIAVSS